MASTAWAAINSRASDDPIVSTIRPTRPVSEFGMVDGSEALTENWCEVCWKRLARVEAMAGL